MSNIPQIRDGQPDAQYGVRQLRAIDAERFRAIRLEGLRLCPEAFGAAFEEEAEWSVSLYAERLSTSVVFGASRIGSDDFDGVVGFFVQAGLKSEHKGKLWGMYVRPSARQAGLGTALVARVVEHATPLVEQIKLTVAASNITASRLYERAGFEAYGLEPGALKIDGKYFDEILMVRHIT